MRAGKLRDRIEIQEIISEPIDSQRQAVPNWHTVYTRWGEVTSTAGGEGFDKAQVSPEVTHQVRMRRELGLEITSKMRLKWGTRILDIAAVLKGTNPDETLMNCTEQVV